MVISLPYEYWSIPFKVFHCYRMSLCVFQMLYIFVSLITHVHLEHHMCMVNEVIVFMTYTWCDCKLSFPLCIIIHYKFHTYFYYFTLKKVVHFYFSLNKGFGLGHCWFFLRLWWGCWSILNNLSPRWWKLCYVGP